MPGGRQLFLARRTVRDRPERGTSPRASARRPGFVQTSTARPFVYFVVLIVVVITIVAAIGYGVVSYMATAPDSSARGALRSKPNLLQRAAMSAISVIRGPGAHRIRLFRFVGRLGVGHRRGDLRAAAAVWRR